SAIAATRSGSANDRYVTRSSVVTSRPRLRTAATAIGSASTSAASAAAAPISSDVRVAGSRYLRFPDAVDNAALLLSANQRISIPTGMPTLIAPTATNPSSTGIV